MKKRNAKEGIRDGIMCVLLTAVLFVMCFVQCVAEDELAKENSEPIQTAQVEQEVIPEATEAPVQTEEPVPVNGDYLAFYNVPLDHGLQCFIISLCEEHHIDPAVVVSMIRTESNYDIKAVGDNGKAFGLMQIQPKWHQDRMDKLGVTDLHNPYENVMVGVDYLHELLTDYYGGNLEKALIAYNAGVVGANKLYFSQGIYSNKYSKSVLGEIEKLTEGMVTVFYSNDPIADFDRWDAEQNKQLERLPVCADCDNPIYDETAYYINGDWICRDCMTTYEREVLPE